MVNVNLNTHRLKLITIVGGVLFAASIFACDTLAQGKGKPNADLVEAGLAGAEIVIGEAHANVLEPRCEFAHAVDFHDRGFVDFNHQVGRARLAAKPHQRIQKALFEGFLGV